MVMQVLIFMVKLLQLTIRFIVIHTLLNLPRIS